MQKYNKVYTNRWVVSAWINVSALNLKFMTFCLEMAITTLRSSIFASRQAAMQNNFCPFTLFDLLLKVDYQFSLLKNVLTLLLLIALSWIVETIFDNVKVPSCHDFK